ncbi:MAG TPA: hypothetical protein VLM76_02045 [Patescibacteria group bacterium]|nr:hypothetical protein [Patescibacteria group bacterium]
MTDDVLFMAEAQLVSDRAAQLVGGTWRFGPVADTPTRLDLPATVRCRKGHESTITIDGRGRRWAAHPIGQIGG